MNTKKWAMMLSIMFQTCLVVQGAQRQDDDYLIDLLRWRDFGDAIHKVYEYDKPFEDFPSLKLEEKEARALRTEKALEAFRMYVSIFRISINEPVGPDKVPPIEIACRLLSNPFVECLLAEGADITKDSKVGGACLDFAFFRHDIGIVKSLLARGARLDNNYTFFINVFRHGLFQDSIGELVDLLITLGADPNKSDENGYENFTPLTKLCYEADMNPSAIIPELIIKLIKTGADVNQQDSGGDLPLVSICRGGKSKFCLTIADILLKAGADVNKSGGRYREVNAFLTPLQAAVSGGNTRLVKRILEAHPEIDQKGFLLHRAALEGSPRLMQMLLQHGLDVNTKNEEGATALIVAARCGNKSVVEYLSELRENKRSLSDEPMEEVEQLDEGGWMRPANIKIQCCSLDIG